MKKLTQLIKESIINYDFIEDVMIHLEDMGFKFTVFNDIGSYKGNRNYLFASDKPNFSLYSFSPIEGVNNYPCYIIALEKNFKPFEDDGSVYLSVVQNVELIKKRLSGCYVSYSIMTNGENGDYSNGDAKLTLIFYIVDKSSAIKPEMVKTLNDIQSFIRNIIGQQFKKIQRFHVTTFSGDSITLRIGDYYDVTEDIIKSAIFEIEAKCKSKWNLKTKSYQSKFMTESHESYYLELKPKL